MVSMNISHNKINIKRKRKGWLNIGQLIILGMTRRGMIMVKRGRIYILGEDRRPIQLISIIICMRKTSMRKNGPGKNQIETSKGL